MSVSEDIADDLNTLILFHVLEDNITINIMRNLLNVLKVLHLM